MKFDFDNDVAKSDPVAVVHLFDGGPKLCLAVRVRNDKTVWFYEDGEVSVQNSSMNENGPGVVAKFYRGDKITITF